jgi:hypothetical protein
VPVIRVASLFLALLAAAVLASTASSRETALPGLMTSKAPWPANNRAPFRARLVKIGLPVLKAEGQVIHTHQHLDVVIRGKGYAIPAGIGIDAHGRFIAPLHTHDITGIVHVESPTVRKYTLGQFFDVWGLRFSSRCVGAYCTKGKDRVWVFVDGTVWLGNPRAIPLRKHDEIVVAYGTYASIPKPIPPAYPFPPGL